MCFVHRELQRDLRKKTEDLVKKSQKLRIASFEKNTKCKKAYELRCREFEKIYEELQAAQAGPPKELDKIKQKEAKAKQAKSLANEEYQAAVGNLEESRVQWEKEMENCCKTFQSMEEERLVFLRRYGWLSLHSIIVCSSA